MLSDLQESPAQAIPRLDRLDRQDGVRRSSVGVVVRPTFSEPALEWWHQVPELVSDRVRLRELRSSDAAALAATLGSAPVGKHLSPGPSSIDETETFILWMRRARRAGRYICFGVTQWDSDEVIGMFQLWPLEPSFRTAEWGFALARPFWGSGVFEASARLAATFAFDTIGVLRLEARAAVDNVRGNGALEKLGACREGVLRKCFLIDGQYRDHVLWAILAEDWRHTGASRMPGEVA